MTENTIAQCACGKPVKHPKSGECGACYARRWYQENKAVGRKPVTTVVSYSGMAGRINRWRGLIKDQTCAVCGERAAHWVYRGGSEFELVEQTDVVRVQGGVHSSTRRYSSNVYDYDPYCRRHALLKESH